MTPRVTGTVPAEAGGPPPLMSGLPAVLADTHFTWSLGLISDDPAGKLALLTGDLRKRPSASGDGKSITSGFSYVDTESAIAWANACRDHLYPVMRQSIELFDLRWCSIRGGLVEAPFHYVSLGPGDGQKDAVILADLSQRSTDLCYVPVDVSPEMLRLAGHAVHRLAKFPRGRILPVQLDLSVPGNLAELRGLLDRLLGSRPALYSLLGNTLANFEDDTRLLATLAGALLRPQDRFVLEVATTPRLDAGAAQDAAAEYDRSRTFREFVTSSLMHYTDLHVDMDSVQAHGSIEADRALLIRVLYQNRTGRAIRLTLPDRTDVSFDPDDTIRLFVSRKYFRGAGVQSLLSGARVERLHGTQSDLPGAGTPFGMELVVLRATECAVPDAPVGPREASLAREVWRR